MRHITNIIGHPDYSFNHCSSIIVPHKIGQVIVGYCGRECTDEQRVFIFYNGQYITLEPKTGNPIIWQHDNKINILYSKFEDISEDGSDKPYSPVDRWKFCSNHHIQIDSDKFLNEGFDAFRNESTKVDGMFGLLARCQPVVFNSECLIPMYREKDPLCEIWLLNGKELVKKSSFGMVDSEWMTLNNAMNSNLGAGIAIQPTLAISKNGLTAYMRNVSRSNKTAWVSSSSDGIIWTALMPTLIPNENNSLVYINSEDKKHKYIIYSSDRSRSDIRLFNTAKKKSINIGRELYSCGRISYSYPNYAWDGDDLHIVHSNCGMIAHHVLSKKYLEKVFDL